MIDLENAVCSAKDCKYPVTEKGCEDDKGRLYCSAECADIVLSNEGIEDPLKHWVSLKKKYQNI